jgi:hypothetical protein
MTVSVEVNLAVMKILIATVLRKGSSKGFLGSGNTGKQSKVLKP